jgi:copper resistance protein D
VEAPDFVAVVLRAATFVAVLQAAGVPLFLWLFRSALEASGGAIRKLGRAAAVAGIVLAAVYQAAEPAHLAGSFSGILDRSLQGMLLASGAGAAFAVRLVALLTIAWSVGRDSRLRESAGIIGSVLVILSFTFVGHTVTHEPRGLLIPLLLIHLLIVAFWFGALLPLYLSATQERISANAVIIDRFSLVAIWLVPVIFVAGLAMAVLLLPSWASLVAPYGALLLGKVGGFAILMGFAAANKWRLGSLIRAGEERALRVFRVFVLTEWGLIAAVLAMTATMTGLFSPNH